jgi:hypothetical protein
MPSIDSLAPVTELAGTQLSSLLETLPGIAKVLRSPVADAMVNLVKAASGQAGFNLADAEELMRYAFRRNLIAADESERVLAETREFLASGPRPVAKADPKPRKVAAPVKAVAPVKVAPPVKAAAPARSVVAKKGIKPLKLKPSNAKARSKPAKAVSKNGRSPHRKK